MTLHNSQHLLDPYTFTHILHGVLLYAVLWLLLSNRMAASWRFVLALGLECAWEVFENTPMVIDKYRTETISLGYYGDSISNSVGDILACAVGYSLAMTLPVWISTVGFVAVELFLLWWIRDSLLLNILMLVWPVEAVKSWQEGEASGAGLLGCLIKKIRAG
jgi:hypothetical protein